MDGMPGMAFHVRLQRSVLAGAERRALIWMARRLPLSVTPDHLSELALAAMFATGASFAALRLTRWAALGVVAGLAVNWFGDSLDGTLARVRRQERPRFGFYVDHVIDLAGTAALFAGMACSGVMSPLVALALLASYLLVMAESFLATHATATFRLSFGGFGPTELRLLLAAGALKLLASESVSLPGIGSVRLFDVGGACAAAALMAVFFLSAANNARSLSLLEPRPRV